MTNIHLQNVDLTSNSGPNCFGRKLFDCLRNQGITFNALQDPVATLAFIQKIKVPSSGKLFQRLDGIYFNSEQNYTQQNKPILETYKVADGVIFQSDFNKRLVTKYFGEHKSSTIIHNGASLELIQSIPDVPEHIQNKHNKIWSCASHWRPHKRLQENIRYFLEHSHDNDVLFVMGKTDDKPIDDPRIRYLGNLKYENVLTILKASDYFIHLAWLDHCPNVVVDARACGAQVICSSSGGTKEIAGIGAVVIKEDEWDLEPVRLYSPPQIDFSQKLKNSYDSEYDMKKVSQAYLKFITEQTNDDR
jgi:glycosyltransferase involved in cell wall biosynthesis